MKRTRSAFPFWTFLLMACFLPGTVQAEPPRKDIDKQIRVQKNSLQELKKSIDQKKEILRDFERKEKGLLSQLQDMDQKLALKEEQLESYDLHLKKIQKEKEQIKAEVESLKSDMARFQSYLSFKVVQIYKYGGYSYVKALFSAESYSELLKRYRYLQLMAQKDRETIESYKKVYEELSKKQQELTDREDKIHSLQSAFKGKNQEILAKREERALLLKKLREEKTAQQELLQELEQSAQSLQETIDALIKKKKPFFGEFEKFKGKFSWPVHGEMVTRFGRQKNEKSSTVIFSKGIEIGADQGTDVKAVYSGNVLFADWFKGYGQMVILDHGDGYYSLYAHLSQVMVTVKETVQEGQPIGKVGDTGSLNGPVLYFEIRYHGEPQDPMVWLAHQ